MRPDVVAVLAVAAFDAANRQSSRTAALRLQPNLSDEELELFKRVRNPIDRARRKGYTPRVVSQYAMSLCHDLSKRTKADG